MPNRMHFTISNWLVIQSTPSSFRATCRNINGLQQGEANVSIACFIMDLVFVVYWNIYCPCLTICAYLIGSSPCQLQIENKDGSFATSLAKRVRCSSSHSIIRRKLDVTESVLRLTWATRRTFEDFKQHKKTILTDIIATFSRNKCSFSQRTIILFIKHQNCIIHVFYFLHVFHFSCAKMNASCYLFKSPRASIMTGTLGPFTRHSYIH